jgi:hypothetical protein
MAELLTENVIKTADLVKLLRKQGLVVTPSNVSRLAQVYGITRPDKVQVSYKDRNSKRIVDIKNPTQFYVKPTTSELKQIKKQYDINQLKAPGTTEAGKKAFEERKAYASKLLQTGEYTQTQVNDLVKKKFPYSKGMMTTIGKLAGAIENVPSGKEGSQASSVVKIRNDLNKLNNSEVKKLMKAGDANLNKLANKASNILNIDKDLAIRRIGQLIEAYGGDDRYLKVKDDLFLRRIGPLIKGIGEVSDTKLFGGIGGGLQRMAAERTVAKDIGKPGTFFSSLRKRIQEMIPSGGYQTDEIKNIRSSARFGTSPYSAFIQGIRSDINQDKAKTLDKQTSIYEKKLQDAETFSEKKQIANEYNKKAKAFAIEANKNLKPGQPPVRTLEISFEEPNKVIKNKSALDNYGDMFDDIYKKHGYSFKVPADVKSVDEIKPFLEGGRGKGKMLGLLAQKAPRIFGIPAAAYLGYQMLDGGEAEAAEPRSDITYNKDLGAFTKTEDQDGVIAPVKVNQAGMLDWVKENPMEVSLGATGVGAIGTKTGRELTGKLLKGIFKTLGSPLAGAAFAGTEIAERLTSDKELTPGEEAISNVSIASSFLFPEIAKRSGAVFGPLLNLGRVGSMFTPIGLGLTAASAAKFMYDDYQKRSAELEKEKLDPDYIEPQYRTDFEGGA